MTPRLRVLRLDADRVVLVLDRVSPGAGPDILAAAAGRLDAAAKRVGATGLLLFDGPVDIPDSDPEPESGTALYADETAALEWAVDTLDRTPVGASPGELHPYSRPARRIESLRLLLDRARESGVTRYRPSPA